MYLREQRNILFLSIREAASSLPRLYSSEQKGSIKDLVVVYIYQDATLRALKFCEEQRTLKRNMETVDDKRSAPASRRTCVAINFKTSAFPPEEPPFPGGEIERNNPVSLSPWRPADSTFNTAGADACTRQEPGLFTSPATRG